jgi:cytochrome c biogenesis protein CcmG/thiol:disulfide interchange protein DsbE
MNAKNDLMSRLTQIMRYLVPLLVFAIILIFLWLGLQQNPREIPSPLLNKPMPTFTAMSLDDQPAPLTDQIFLNHVTVLNVWASWCMSCQAEHPFLMDISKKGQFMLYGLDYKDTREAATDYLKQHGNPYMVDIYDPKGQLGINLGVYGTPETFVIDQNGIIRYKYAGPITPDVWEKDFIPVLQDLTNNDN